MLADQSTMSSHLLEQAPALSQAEFECFREFIHRRAGINLSAAKVSLVRARLVKRLQALALPSFTAYWAYLMQPGHEREQQIAINQLSTNETYFFREPAHFAWLERYVRRAMPGRRAPLRVWSAACSTGEEPYSIAMTLADALGLEAPWTVLASDVNTRVTLQGQRAVYPQVRARGVPAHLSCQYLLRGKEEYQGQVRMAEALIRRVDFRNINLLEEISPSLGEFDLVFLRNVLIYFDAETKRRVIARLCRAIRPGGYLLVGHTDAFDRRGLPLRSEGPSIFRVAAD